MRSFVSALLLLFVAASVCGRTELPAGGTLVAKYESGMNIGFWRGSFEGEPVGDYEEVAADHPDFDVALRITVHNPSGNFWTGGGRVPINASASKGDVGLVRVYIRTIKTLAEIGTAVSTVFVQGPQNEKSVVRSVTSDKEWSEFLIPFEFAENYGVGEVALNFGMGAGRHAQTYELAGFEVYHYGTSLSVDDLPETALTYPGRELDATWRIAAAERIEQHRKGDFTLKVVDADGASIPFARIQSEMTRHAFEFGSAFSTFAITEDSSNGEMLRQKTVELFNSGGPFNHMKWKAWAGDFGPSWTEEKLIEALSWAKGQGLSLRGHVLVWPGRSHLPKSIQDLIPEDPAGADPSIKQLAIDHIDAITTATKDYVTEWDVLNEPYDNHVLMDAFGKEVMVDWFERARLNLPEHALYLNDYNILSTNTAHQNHYEETVRYLLDNGAPITGMGMQGHYGSSPTGIPDVEDALKRYTTAFPELDLRVTEFTVDTKDEQLQADYLRDYYTLLFSYPQVVGIQQWGFWSNSPDATKTMYDHEWREKPSGAAYRKLVFDDWWTSFTGYTSRAGSMANRGFYGDYEALVTVGGVDYSLSFEHSVDGAEIVLSLPVSLVGESGGYDAWATATFTADQLADAELSGPSGDVDGDGLSNQIEYVFQLDSGTREAGPFQSLAFDEVSGAFFVEHKWPHAGSPLALQFETSTDLTTWHPAVVQDEVTGFEEYLLVNSKITHPSEKEPVQFLRFRVLEDR
ncbi:endo-1,4-beta-xylanase [Pelagicoccus mobilis]|uniref:Beta-xylanase n=1 Tax=Pelagicoccus mobilis TaxID=415221 RepID=A0A934RTP6_9BACT|nr:endo-1,4-beta-xylanase [Pelagicoccus mobilis]MBK1876692.1 endo-1,4-beta-xylanase [Pelagicoccus mobilis]